MKTCPRCNTQNQPDAQFCSNCALPFAALPVAETSLVPKKKSISTSVGIIIAVASMFGICGLLGVVMAIFDKDKPAQQTNQTNNSAPVLSSGTPVISPTQNTTTPAPTAATSAWEYRESTDEMTSKPVKHAATESINTLQFNFPYDGGSKSTLIVRRKDNKDDVVLTISKGQFISNLTDNRAVSVRFDDRPAFNVTYSDPSDYSSTKIFLDNEAKIISEMKKSLKLKLQVEFYGAGKQILEFDVKDFKW